MPDPEKVYRVKQAAERMEISERKVQYLITEGKLAAYNVGRCLRIKERDIQNYERGEICIYQEKHGVSDELDHIF